MISNSYQRVNNLRDRASTVLSKALFLEKQTRCFLLIELIWLPRKSGPEFLRSCRAIEKILNKIDREITEKH